MKPDTVKRDTVKHNTVKPDVVKPDVVKPDTLSTPRQEPAGAGASFIPDDAPLSSSDLPPDFWGVPADDEHSEPSEGPAHDREQEDARAEPTAPAGTLSSAFDQMQSLFPGRVLEVISPAEEASASADDDPAPLDDEILGDDGYDGDDQDRLTFGASRDA